MNQSAESAAEEYANAEKASNGMTGMHEYVVQDFLAGVEFARKQAISEIPKLSTEALVVFSESKDTELKKYFKELNWRALLLLQMNEELEARIDRDKNPSDEVRAVLEACEDIQCECTIKERLSGHRSNCSMPQLQEALETYRQKIGAGK